MEKNTQTAAAVVDTTAAATSETATATAAAAKPKKPKKPKKQQPPPPTVSCTVITETAGQMYKYEAGKLPQLIGSMIANNAKKVVFSLFGCVVEIPSEAGENDKTKRFLKACQTLTGSIFAGHDREQSLKTDSEGIATVAAELAKYFKSGSVTFAGINNNIKHRLDIKRELIGYVKDEANRQDAAAVSTLEKIKTGRKLHKEGKFEESVKVIQSTGLNIKFLTN